MEKSRSHEMMQGNLDMGETGNPRDMIDRDFGNDTEEKILFVKATLERMREGLKNSESGDATNLSPEQISQMENYREAIPEYEAMLEELEAMQTGESEAEKNPELK